MLSVRCTTLLWTAFRTVPEFTVIPTSSLYNCLFVRGYTQTLENSTTICSQHRARPKGGALRQKAR